MDNSHNASDVLTFLSGTVHTVIRDSACREKTFSILGTKDRLELI